MSGVFQRKLEETDAVLAVLVVVLAAEGHAARHDSGVLQNLEDG